MVSLMQDLSHLTKAELRNEIDRLQNKVQELELALRNRTSNLELATGSEDHVHRANRSLAQYLRLALFPLVTGVFRRIYKYAYRQKG
jgi:tyrosine-protein phosphatase YwqE